MRAATLFLLTTTIALCGEIVLPPTLDRAAPVHALYRTNRQATGSGELSIHWTDVLGRVVADRKIPFQLTDETDVGFSLDLRRAVAMQNQLSVRFSFDGVDKSSAKDHRDESAAITFIARPPDSAWWDYNIMAWQSHTPAQVAALKALGINAGQYSSRSRTAPAFLLDNDERWYAESVATDFYSEYHRYRPDRIQNWSYLQVKELYKRDPSSREPLKRHPSFSDPAWRQKIHDRAVECARFFSPYRPIFYSLGDEPGIADLSAYWEFDFSDQALVEMRDWLKQRYATLARLNQQWGSAFASWDQVTPQTTAEAMRRPDDNYSAWADHKEWMDISFAGALKMGADAIREVDPQAYVGIGGAQMPGWGGYDYYRLTQALTALEPYDIGNNIEIVRSLNPQMALVTTAFAHGPWEKHRVWYELLHGSRGLILWDDKSEFIGKDGVIGDRGRETSVYYNELRNGLAAQLIASRRVSQPVAIHYSQSSLRVDWMLARKPEGDAWLNRRASTDRLDSEFLRLRESYCRLLEDLGLQYDFVAYGQIENGELLKRGYRVLILPRSLSLSGAEAAAIREFVAQGGTLITESEPGVYDEHGKKRPVPPLAGLGKRVAPGILTYHQDRLTGKEGATLRSFGKLLQESGIEPVFALKDAGVGVETHTFRNGGVWIVALLTNPQLRVDELGPPDFKSNSRFEKPRALKLALPGELSVYDLRTGKALGKRNELNATLDPYEPAIYAVSPTPLPTLLVSAPRRIARGRTGQIGLSFAAPSPAARHVLHVDVVDPSGQVSPHYSGNVLANRGVAAKAWPVAVNDPAGAWEIRVKDLLTGQSHRSTVEVY